MLKNKKNIEQIPAGTVGMVVALVVAGKPLIESPAKLKLSYLAIHLEGVYVDPQHRSKGYGLRCLSQPAGQLLTRSKSVCLTVNENLRAPRSSTSALESNWQAVTTRSICSDKANQMLTYERQRFTNAYKWGVVFIGAVIFCFSVGAHLSSAIDLRFLSAGTILYFVNTWGFYALVAAIPVISIVYFTYYKYLEDLRVTSAQAESAEHARAEAERRRAEQAERHIEELSRHIAEQDRISRALEESKDHFRHAAFHDELTGLPNRALLTEHIKLAIERPRGRDEQLFAVLFLDLDRFKNINDSLGHIAGDQLLTATARCLEECMRPMDTVARLGGDEFAILLDGLENQDHAVMVADRIQQALTRPFNLNGHEVFITTSIGITLSNGGYGDPENVLRDADTAMYRAKEGGKARSEVFDSSMHSHAVALLQLENDLRRAIERNEFEVYYQPITSLASDEISGFEALVRWNHPERGLVCPSDFIPTAEETGLIVDIGSLVLRESCRQLQEWQSTVCQRPISMSVNLSGKQFAQPDLVAQVKEILDETGLDPKYLKLEITESVVMENAEVARTMLGQLCRLGVHLCIDDFGTGYSSLSYLHRFPVKTLKIDRSFIGRMGPDGENAEVVKTINTLANNLGMEVVAEGVETEEQLTQLKAMRCGFGQGYLISRPLIADAARLFLQTHQLFVVPTIIEEGLVESQLQLVN